jgi:hypothetical protein
MKKRVSCGVVCACVRPGESPPNKGGVTSISETPPLIEEEVPFQNAR